MHGRVRAMRGLCAGCVACAATMSGCAARAPAAQSPQVVVRAFAQALSEGDTARAYGMMSPDYRRRVRLSEFKKHLESNPQEVLALGSSLSHVTGSATAVLHDAEGTAFELQWDGAHWVVGAGVVDFYDQSSPRSALRAFVHALEQKRYDVMLRLMPEADKEGVTTESMEKAWGYDARDEVARLLTRLRAHLQAPIEITGNRATMPYAEHFRVQFVREDGRWKIEDPQ